MQDRPDKPKSRKKAVNVSIDADLLAEAKAFGTNLSATLEAALRVANKERRWAEWRATNSAAIAASNREIEENGLWADDYRVW